MGRNLTQLHDAGMSHGAPGVVEERWNESNSPVDFSAKARAISKGVVWTNEVKYGWQLPTSPDTQRGRWDRATHAHVPTTHGTWERP